MKEYAKPLKEVLVCGYKTASFSKLKVKFFSDGPKYGDFWALIEIYTKSKYI